MSIIEEIVIEGYNAVLKREPDSQGLKYFMDELSNKRISREQFLDILTTSQEYKDKFEKKIINFYQNFPTDSGYGILGKNIHNTLLKYNYQTNNFTGQHLGIFQYINAPYTYFTLILSTPLSFFKSNSRITIGYTMFESNRIPDSWVFGCNTVDRLFVPIESNVDAFKNCGVNIPIDVIPIGIDISNYNPSSIITKFDFGSIAINNAYKFLFINEDQSRKNNKMIVDAFHQEFEKEIERNEAYLIIRTRNEFRGKNIFYINRFLSEQEMPYLINSCDCMINVSSGECGDIPIIEAMALEKPVIVSDDHLLHSEIITDEITGFLVSAERWEPAFKHWSYAGAPYLKGLSNHAIWAIPSINSLKQKMRYVYDNREIAKTVGKQARQYVLQNRTIDISIQKMTNIFENL